MKLHYFHQGQDLPVSAETAWAFFANPANLLRLMPDWMAMQPALANKPAPPQTVYPGWVEVYRVKPRFLPPSTWVSEITQVQAPHYFVDEQKHGPFAFWHHTHTVIPTANGCRIEDSLVYGLPYGIFGEMAHTLLVSKMIHAMFQHREAVLPHLIRD